MTHLNQLNQWARTPKPNDAAAWVRSLAMLNQVVEAKRHKIQALRRHGRSALMASGQSRMPTPMKETKK